MSPTSQLTADEMDVDTRFDSLMCEISTRFISIPADQVDRAIENAQRIFCVGCGLDRSTLWQPVQGQPGSVCLTHFCTPNDHPTVTAVPDPRMLNSSDWVLKSPGTPSLYKAMDSKAFLPWISERIQ